MNPPAALAGASSGGLSMPQYQTVSVSSGSSNQVDLGLSAQCYSEPSTCSSGIVTNPLETSEVEGACVDAAAGCFCSTSNKAADRRKEDCPGNGNSQQYQYRVFQSVGAGGHAVSAYDVGGQSGEPVRLVFGED